VLPDLVIQVSKNIYVHIAHSVMVKDTYMSNIRQGYSMPLIIGHEEPVCAHFSLWFKLDKHIDIKGVAYLRVLALVVSASSYIISNCDNENI
jgi:hypothetical protein